jgi:hypothetical protein
LKSGSWERPRSVSEMNYPVERIMHSVSRRLSQATSIIEALLDLNDLRASPSSSERRFVALEKLSVTTLSWTGYGR